MKTIILSILTAASMFAAETSAAAVYAQGHYRRNGTYVQPYRRSAPDSSYSNNYSSQGNVNPYTGQQGTVTYDQYQNQRQQPQGSHGNQPCYGAYCR